MAVASKRWKQIGELAKAGAEKANEARHEHAERAASNKVLVERGKIEHKLNAATAELKRRELPMTLTSHDEGKNATVTVYPDRIERERARSLVKLRGAQAEVIPIAAISAVSAEKKGVWVTVTAMTNGQAVTFRLAQGDASRFRDVVTQLVMESHAPPVVNVTVPAAAAPVDVAAQLRELGDLHGSGVLTDDEFAAAKARLLG